MSLGARILVVDDTQSFRFMVKGYLDDAGYQVTCVASGANALEAVERSPFDLVLSDMVMPEMDGLELLHQIRTRYPQLPFVLMTAHGSVDTAVAAMKDGADDYLLKPLNWEELLIVVKRLLDHAKLRVNYERMVNCEREQYSFQSISSGSAVMGKTLAVAQQVAASARTTIAIYGESGVDKEVLARACGHLYLVAIMDWAPCKVLSWRLSNTLDTRFCVEALKDALVTYGAPEIFNSDQGCQFTSEAFTSVLKAWNVKISMDGKGRFKDNIFIERLWRSLKYERIYLKGYETGVELHRDPTAWFSFYNEKRKHTSLDKLTPNEVYEQGLQQLNPAARCRNPHSYRVIAYFTPQAVSLSRTTPVV